MADIERLEIVQRKTLAAAADRFCYSGSDLQAIQDFADQQGLFVISYQSSTETFIFSDGEPYSLQAVQAEIKI